MSFVLFWTGSVSRSVGCNVVNGVVGRLPAERFRHGGRPLDTMLRTAWTIASCRPKSGSLRKDKCGNSKVIWNGSQWLLRALSIPEWLYLGSAGAPLGRKSFTTETRRFGFYRVFSVIAVISVVDFHPYGDPRETSEVVSSVCGPPSRRTLCSGQRAWASSIKRLISSGPWFA